MTLSTLICTKCQYAIAVSDRSVVLPFVCKACQNPDLQAYEARLATGKQRADALLLPLFKCGNPKCVCYNDPGFTDNLPSDTPDCSESSVEATTQLIDDLNAQLESERATVIETKELLAKTEDLLLKQTSYCEVLGDQLAENSQNTTSVIGRNIDLLAEIDELKTELEESHTQEEKCYKTIAVLLNQKYEAEGAIKFAGELLTSVYAAKA
jgi:endogenous inhibitor of DNA gyrase (YacG/DUF329 family)